MAGRSGAGCIGLGQVGVLTMAVGGGEVGVSGAQASWVAEMVSKRRIFGVGIWSELM